MGLTKFKLGELIQLSTETNSELEYGVDDVRGISIKKMFIDTKADMTGVSLKPYSLVKPDSFAYVTITSRNGEKISIAHNDTTDTYIVSSSYVVFNVSRTDILSSDYLFMYFNRPEFDRYSRFNSWGSAREAFSWDDMCDIDIELPTLPIQQKYVDIYNAMLANQRAYETGLEDLRITCEIEIDKIKHIAQKIPTGKLLENVDVRNTDGAITAVQGINITKNFMPSVASVAEGSLQNYKVVQKGQFAYSSMQTGRDECIRIALLQEDEPIIVSPAYSVLQVKNNDVLAEYIMMWFSRSESDRYGWFASDGSIRANLDLDRFYEIDVPVPDIKEQEDIVGIYNAYLIRRDINEKLKEQIKDLCPILIKGSLEEANT
ncbi:restriction endonuclease subunit S [Clostridium sp. BJN0013]|uniref:restriction endonuclease subunit S n=1 Tax=Clostridium sp. BJN0013 TaxID=3236840 RepID=UPI0034C5B594